MLLSNMRSCLHAVFLPCAEALQDCICWVHLKDQDEF